MATRKSHGSRLDGARRPRLGIAHRAFESLEERQLLTVDPWQNPVNHYDVRGTGVVSPTDALAIIQALNEGITTLPAVNSSSSATSGTASAGLKVLAASSATQSSAITPQNLGYLDVTGTGVLSPTTALAEIRALVTTPDMTNELETVDASGNVITSIGAGGVFYLEDVVVDDRGVAATGVEASYSTVSYNSSLAAISPSGPITYGATFTGGQSGDLTTPGTIANIGASQSAAPSPTTQQQVLWSVPVVAGTTTGPLTFGNNAGTSNTMLFGAGSPESTSGIDFIGASISVTQASVSINSVLVPEPTANGLVNAVFTVSMNGPISQSVTVSYATQNNTAIAGTDYVAQSNYVTFTPNGSSNPVSQTITVPILADAGFSGNANFFVNLTSPNPSTTPFLQATGIGTISKSAQSLSISPLTTSVVENGGSPAQSASLTVTLSSASSGTVTVDYSTADENAAAGTNYQATSGTLTFAPGVLTQTITVPIDNVALSTPVSFVVNLSNASNAYISTSQGTVTIYPQGSTLAGAEAAVNLKITDTSGNVITSAAPGSQFDVEVDVNDLRTVSDGGIFAAYLNLNWNSAAASQDGAIQFGSNFTNVENSGTQSAGSIANLGATSSVGTPVGSVSQQLLVVPMIATGVGTLSFTATPSTVGVASPGAGDDVLEYNNPDDPLQVTALPTATNGTTVTYGKVEFTSSSFNVGSNALAIAGPVAPVNVPTTGTTTATFTVTRSAATSSTVTVNYATQDGTAVAGTDYTAKSGTLTFAPGVLTQTITVTVLANTLNEPNKTFSVSLSGASVGATITTPSATATLVSTAAEPTIDVSTTSVSEGSPATVTFTLVGAGGAPLQSGQTITVTYATADGTAIAGTNYTTTTGTVTFAPGATTETITIPTIYDPAQTGSVSLTLNLTNPTNATLATSSLPITITYVQAVGISGFVYVDSNNDGVKESNEAGIAGVTITLNETSGGSLTETTTTNAAGYYSFIGLPPGTYSITETQPGFYVAGKNTPGTPAPTGATVGNTFNGIVIASGVSATNYDFGELGLRAQFVSTYLNRRAFIASSIVTQEYGTPVVEQNFNLAQGNVWISFDSGWSGLRTIQGQYNASAGSVTLTLYDNNFNVLATSSGTPATLSYNGSLGSPYFLEITGTNTDVNLVITGGSVVAVGSASGASGSGASSGSGGASSGSGILVAAASGSSATSSSPNLATTASTAPVGASSSATTPAKLTTTSTAATDTALSETSLWIGGFIA